MLGATNITKNNNKSKYMYSVSGIALDRKVRGGLVMTLFEMLFLVLIIVHHLIVRIS